MSKFVRLWRRILTFFSWLIQTAAVLSAVLTILTFLGLGSAAYGYINQILPVTLIGIGVFVLSVMIFIFLYTLLESKMKAQSISTVNNPSGSSIEDKTKVLPISTDTIVYPTPPREDEVEILQKEIAYEYSKDGQTMWQRKRLHIKALKNGVDRFTDRYRWTGSGKCTVQMLTPDFQITNERKEEFTALWDYFDVTFPHPLHKGEEIDFTLEWELFDEQKIAVPFLATLIDRETKHLLLQVVLPPKLAPTRAYCHEFANNIDTLPIVTHPIKWSAATQRISFDVPNPKKYHKYSIRWYYD